MGELRPLAAAPRTPPYSIDAEQRVLGAMMLDNRSIAEVRAVLSTQHFYRADHQVIFAAICEMADARKPVDFTTLLEFARARGDLEEMGGLSNLAMLWQDTLTANVMTYADIVRQRATLRSLIAIGGDIAEMGYQPDGREVSELIVDAQKRVSSLALSADTSGDPIPLSDDIAAWSDEYHARKKAEKAPGLQTGFRDLDRIIIGLEPGDLMVLAGASGMGKTVAGLTIADHVAVHYGAVLGFSLEMPRKQWLTRLVASHAEIPLQLLRDPRQADHDVDDKVTWGLGRISSLPFYVSDQAGQTIHQIRSRAMRLHAKHPLKLILVDYIQLVAGDRRSGDTRTNEMDSVSRGLKALAKDIGVPIIALAQLSREVEKRDNKRPRKSDLRESGGIEQDADIIGLMYRDCYYEKQSPHRDILEIEIAKQRNGALDTAELSWQGGFCKMTDYYGPSASERIAAAKASSESANSERSEKRGMKSPKTLLPKHLQP